MSIGINIKNARENKKISRQEFANKLDVTDVTISRYENGKREPSYDILNKMSRLLEVSIDELVNGASSIYVNRLNRNGANIKRDVSELTTQELIQELNSRNDFPIKIEMKK